MMRLAIILFTVCFNAVLFGQNAEQEPTDFVVHQVKQGETIRLISQRYLVTPSDIYRDNKFAINGISQGMTLQIPVKRKAVKPAPSSNSELETLDAIQDAVALETAANETIIKNTEAANKKQADAFTSDGQSSIVEHKVVAGETLSSLSRKYETSVTAIKNDNGQLLGNGLKVGQVIKINTKQQIARPVVKSESAEVDAPTSNAAVVETNTNVINHIVEPKETLYSIARKYGVSVDVLKQQNQKLLAHGLQTGQVIKIKPNN